MYVATFLQILFRHTSYGMTHPEFVRQLMEHASDSVPKGHSDEAYQKYLKGIPEKNGDKEQIIGDKIGDFARKYLKEIKEVPLDHYLADLIKKTDASSQLRTAFQKEFAKLPPDASEDDIKDVIMDYKGNNIAEETVQLAKQIRRLFVHVINECIREYTRKRHKGKASTSSTSDISRSDLDGRHKEAETYESGMEYNPLYAVDSSLNKLIKIGRMIAEYEKENAFGKIPAFRSPLRSELQSEFERLRQLADALLTSEESSATPAFDEIAMIIFHLTADTFVLTEFEYRIITPQNERLHQLLDLVMQLRTDFTPSNNNTPIN